MSKWKDKYTLKCYTCGLPVGTMTTKPEGTELVYCPQHALDAALKEKSVKGFLQSLVKSAAASYFMDDI